MSSAGSGEPELKGGHPPAVKAGGMRVARHRTNSQGEKVEVTKQEEEEEFEVTPPKESKHTQQMLISGAVTKGDKDFPPEAVKQYHDKPLPSKEKRPAAPTHTINQPR